MELIKTIFIITAVISVGMNLYKLVTEEENSSLKLNAAMGWFCAILWAIM